MDCSEIGSIEGVVIRGHHVHYVVAIGQTRPGHICTTGIRRLVGQHPEEYWRDAVGPSSRLYLADDWRPRPQIHTSDDYIDQTVVCELQVVDVDEIGSCSQVERLDYLVGAYV